MSDEETPVVEVKPIAGIGTKVFGKWDASEVSCRDPGLAPYINLTTVGVPIPVAATPTHGSGKPNFLWLNATSTNSCARVLTLGRKWVQ